ncbi:MAG: hypothetical protein J7J02_04640 [Sulfurovum sp.]|nr:hypothetical protein [Sulfurovum sp.]
MKVLSEEQIIEIENREKYIEEKAELLKEYKSYAENLEYADDEFEEDMIMQKREKLAVQIKALGAKIREIKALESEA